MHCAGYLGGELCAVGQLELGVDVAHRIAQARRVMGDHDVHALWLDAGQSRGRGRRQPGQGGGLVRQQNGHPFLLPCAERTVVQDDDVAAERPPPTTARRRADLIARAAEGEQLTAGEHPGLAAGHRAQRRWHGDEVGPRRLSEGEDSTRNHAQIVTASPHRLGPCPPPVDEGKACARRRTDIELSALGAQIRWPGTDNSRVGVRAGKMPAPAGVVQPSARNTWQHLVGGRGGF